MGVVKESVNPIDCPASCLYKQERHKPDEGEEHPTEDESQELLGNRLPTVWHPERHKHKQQYRYHDRDRCRNPVPKAAPQHQHRNEPSEHDKPPNAIEPKW